MNWSDLLVLGIIAGFAIIGMASGFIYSVFRLASFLISAFLAVKLYPLVSKILEGTHIYTNIRTSIYKSLMLQQQVQAPAVDGHVKQAAADTIINSLQLPGFLKGTLLNQIPNPTKLVDISKIMNTISGELSKLVIDVISLIALYILIRFGLIFLRFILQGIAKLPLFKQIDKLGGFALGGVEGLLTVYIVFAVLMLLHTVPQFKGFFESVDNSLIAKFFYQHNFIIDWMFPKG
jgi:uncharacterized membrane protein required for colicin V production